MGAVGGGCNLGGNKHTNRNNTTNCNSNILHNNTNKSNHNITIMMTIVLTISDDVNGKQVSESVPALPKLSA